MEDNYHLANKKGLLLNLKEFYQRQGRCIFGQRVFPQTFLIGNGYDDEEYFRLQRYLRDHPETISSPIAREIEALAWTRSSGKSYLDNETGGELEQRMRNPGVPRTKSDPKRNRPA